MPWICVQFSDFDCLALVACFGHRIGEGLLWRLRVFYFLQWMNCSWPPYLTQRWWLWVSDHSENAKLKISRDTVSNYAGTHPRYSFLYTHPLFWMLLPVKKSALFLNYKSKKGKSFLMFYCFLSLFVFSIFPCLRLPVLFCTVFIQKDT